MNSRTAGGTLRAGTKTLSLRARLTALLAMAVLVAMGAAALVVDWRADSEMQQRFDASLLARAGVDLPPELLDLLTYGRGVDNRLLKAQGFEYRYTSAGAVRAFAEAARLRRTVGGPSAYRYERDVEQFFRHSPAVVRDQG